MYGSSVKMTSLSSPPTDYACEKNNDGQSHQTIYSIKKEKDVSDMDYHNSHRDDSNSWIIPITESMSYQEDEQQSYDLAIKEESLHAGKKLYVCYMCDTSFDDSIALKKHLVVHSGMVDAQKDFGQVSHIKQEPQDEVLDEFDDLPIVSAKLDGREDIDREEPQSKYDRNIMGLISNLASKHEATNKCPICSKFFSRSFHLKGHMMTHTGEKPHKCDICDRGFSQASSLKTHAVIHTQEKPHMCDICAKKFKQRSALKRHMLTHTGAKSYKCHFCEKHYTDFSSLRKHCVANHIDELHKSNAIKKTSAGNIMYNMKLHNDLLEFASGEKPIEYNKSDSMSFDPSHYKKSPAAKRRYKCDLCDTMFVHISQLTEHMNTHTGEIPHVCHICNKPFARLSSLQRHVRTHTGEKHHKCNICEKAFIDSSNLKHHLVTHFTTSNVQNNATNTTLALNDTQTMEDGNHDDRTVDIGANHEGIEDNLNESDNLMLQRATTCSGNDYDKYNTSHSNVPTELDNFEVSQFEVNPTEQVSYTSKMVCKDKSVCNRRVPNICTYCDKTFKKLSHLKEHVRIHTGEKPHKCTYCGKGFVQKSSLKVHMRLHTGERPHKCDICDKQFTHSGALRSHMLTHTGERPHQCDICEKHFRDIRSLRCHYMTHMNNSKIAHAIEKIAYCDKDSFDVDQMEESLKIPNQPEATTDTSEDDSSYDTATRFPRSLEIKSSSIQPSHNVSSTNVTQRFPSIIGPDHKLPVLQQRQYDGTEAQQNS